MISVVILDFIEFAQLDMLDLMSTMIKDAHTAADIYLVDVHESHGFNVFYI